ncbi:MAG: UDP-N-acetyl-D-galactosamine dehydrogenase [Coxiella sp. DG_40]|nr:MAG: UDP-N-acetyl-D-galactosamine dehydrogenase [Coxiella sp. DG_40]
MASDIKSNLDDKTVCVIGLGYVGLPLVEAFAKKLMVIGFDIKSSKIAQLNNNNNCRTLTFTDNAEKIAEADFIIICVPTPVTKSKEPDLSYVKSAASTIGKNMKKGCVVILESTVYPGVTEDIVRPILEQKSRLKCGEDFKVAYSPERVNPGDKEHSIDKIPKVVAGMDEETTELVAGLYGKINNNIYKAKDIKTAEAAKVIENIQRDLNIALVNELSLIFDKLNLSTKDVLDTAATKWNFHRYSPGLVGGHCIPVDPYYLVHRAKEFGYHSQVILAGRAINDSMAKHVAEITIKALNEVGKVIKGSRILIMGLTYKENVADTRETPLKQVIKELKEYGIIPFGYDPVLGDSEDEFDIQILKSLEQGIKFDGIILAVVHDAFRDDGEDISLDKLKTIMNSKPVLIDVKGYFNGRRSMEEHGFYYRTL